MSNYIAMKVRVAHESIELPTYETTSSAGMDLRAYLPDGSITLETKQRVLVGTGLYFEIPEKKRHVWRRLKRDKDSYYTL